MTVPGNGTLKRILAGVMTAVIVFLIGAVVAGQSRITAVEVEMMSIKEALKENRAENRDEHRAIGLKLDEIAKEIRK